MQFNFHRIILAVLLFIPISGWAQTYLIDFGQAQLPAPSSAWLKLLSGAVSNEPLIVESSMTADPSATITHDLGFDSNSTNWSAGTDIGWVVSAAGNDGAYTSSATGTITFGGLNDNYTYSVQLVSAEDNAAGNFPSTADFQVNGSFADSNFIEGTGGNLGDDWDTNANGVGNWLTWDSVAPSGGNIVVSITASSGFTTINAIRLNVVTTPVELQSFEVE